MYHDIIPTVMMSLLYVNAVCIELNLVLEILPKPLYSVHVCSSVRKYSREYRVSTIHMINIRVQSTVQELSV